MRIVRKVFRLEGMHCEACARTAGLMLMAVQGVKSVRADYDTRSAEVEYNDSVSTPDLNRALEGLGYRLEELT